jgi:hypothetical protein
MTAAGMELVGAVVAGIATGLQAARNLFKATEPAPRAARRKKSRRENLAMEKISLG